MSGHELWLVRHARVTAGPGTCYGKLDVAADPAHTQASAQRLALALTDSHRSRPMPLVLRASPSARAQVLATCLRESLPPDCSATVGTDARLAEMDFGDWEGRPWDDIDREALDAWAADFHQHRPGGGENVAAVLARVAAALQALRATPTPQRVVWFTHAGVIRAVEVLITRPPLPLSANDWPQSVCEPGSWRVLSGSALGPAEPGQP